MAARRSSNFYAHSGLDRAGRRRKDAAWVAARLADEASRVVPVWRSRNFFAAADADVPAPVYLGPGEVRDLAGDEAETVLLGLLDDVAHVAVDFSHIEAPEAMAPFVGRGRFLDLRQVGAALDRRTGALLAYARGILTWHRRHRYCGRCGAETVAREGGHVRLCVRETCGALHFPRTDPAVIMLVTLGDKCLLGRQAAWPQGMYSTLAGFVEPGESLEEAVAREVLEETGVRVTDVAYHSSQPWPFPSSLMLGFHARAEGEALNVDYGELEDARWFSRRWIQRHEGGRVFRLPRADSIARALVDSWLAGEAP